MKLKKLDLGNGYEITITKKAEVKNAQKIINQGGYCIVIPCCNHSCCDCPFDIRGGDCREYLNRERMFHKQRAKILRKMGYRKEV